MPAISQPGITVNQEYTAPAATVASPDLVPVIVGPCYHVVDAVNASNTFNSSALAGSYRANIGTQSYSMPGLSSYTGAILDTTSIKVYLDKLNGTPQAALRSVSDESILISATSTGTLTANLANPFLTDSGIADFQVYGITARTATTKGDVVRLTHLGRSYDLEIIDLVDSGNSSVIGTTNAAVKLKLDVSAYSIDGTASVLDSPLYNVGKTSLSYNVIDKPADYVVKTSAQNATTHQIGDGTNYFHFEAQGAMAGAEAEKNNFKVILKAAQNESGTNNGYADGSLLIHSGGGLASVAAGDVVLFDATTVSGTFAKSAVVAEKINNKALGLTTDGLNGGGSNKDAIIGTEYAAAETATFDNSTGVITSPLTTTTPYNFATATNITVGIKVGSNYYKGTIGSTPGEVTLVNAGSNAIADGTPKSITHIVVMDENLTGVDEGANTFASATLGSSTINGNYIYIGGSYLLTSSGVADNMITVSGITAKLGLSWVSVPAGAGHGSGIGTAVYSSTSQTVTITFERDSGTLPSITQIQNALTSGHSDEFGADITALIKVAGVAGTPGTDIDEDSVTEFAGTLGQHTYPFEGGADANQIILDGKLTSGNAVNVYIGYRALRVDLSGAASDPSLTTINSLADIEAKIGRSDTTQNPLGLAAKLALTNTVGNTSIKVLGISAANSAELTTSPNGSSTAYAEALTMLESEDVYALAPLSSDREIATLFSNHATTMSSATNKGERIAFVSRPFPQYSQATLIASGTNGSTSATFNSVSSGAFTAGVDFGLGGANFASLKAAIDAGDEIILVLNSYKTSTVAGRELLGAASQQYGFRVTAVNSSNTSKLDITVADALGSTTNDLTAQSWYLYVQGKAITEVSDQASRAASYGSEYASRRTFLVWPPRVVATVGTNSEFLDGHFLASTVAACVGFQAIGKGFTNLTISGFTGLRYSNRYFSKSQLDTIAGGGTLIVVQDTETGPLKIRHQLATDVSTVQKRELSITKAIDYFAKTLRDSLADRIGGSNITTEFIEGLGMNVQAIVASMVQRSIITGATLSSIKQDTTNPDTINIHIRVSPLYPCNYIEITLQL